MLVRLVRVATFGILLVILAACGEASSPAPLPVTAPTTSLPSTGTPSPAPTLTRALAPSSTPTVTPTPTFTPTPTAALRGCSQAGEAPAAAPLEPSQPTDVLLQLEWGAGRRWPVSYEGTEWPYGSEPFGRVPELTLLPDGRLFYLEGDVQVVHLTEEEAHDLVQSVLDLGLERLESATDLCRPLADGTCQCVADASSSTLRLRMPGGELRELINYANYANYPHTMMAIRALLEAYRHPAAQRYAPEHATLFIQWLVDAYYLDQPAWPLDPAWLPPPEATDGPCTQIVSGGDLKALLNVTYGNVGIFDLGQAGQSYEVQVIPWLPGADYTALVQARSRPWSPSAGQDGSPAAPEPSATPGALSRATPAAGSHVVLLAKPAPTVHPGWTTYPARHGVVGLAVDVDGHVWAATYAGALEVNAEDGTYTRYAADEGLPMGWTSVIAAPDGTLWFGTFQGIEHLAGETWTSYTVAGGQQDICNLQLAPGEKLWAEGCRWSASKESWGGDVAVYDGKEWRAARPEDGPPPDFTAVQAPDGTVWAPRDRGVARLDGESWTEFANPDWPTQVVGQAIAAAPDGSIWVGTQSGGAARFGGQSWTTWTTDQGLPSDRVEAVAVAPDGSVWAGAWDGLARLDGETWTSYATGGGVAGDEVYHIAIGPGGTHWFSTDRGFSLLDGQTWTSYLWASGGWGSSPLGIAPDGTAWILPATALRRVDGESWPSSYPPLGEVDRIVPSPDGSLWLSGPGRLVHFVAAEPEAPGRPSPSALFQSTVYEAGCLSGSVLTGLAPAPDGMLWIGTGSSGVVQFDPQAAARGEMACTFHTGLGDEADTWVESVAAVAVMPGSEVEPGYEAWAGTVDGLSRYDGRAWTLKTDVGACPYTHEVHALAVTPDGVLWAGVPCGLGRFDGRDWSVYTVADGLAAAWVHSLAADPDGSLWVGTSAGVQHFRPGEAPAPGGAGR